MKDKFSEFYSSLPGVNVSDIDKLVLVFDTNILMYLYFFDEKMQDLFFYNMKKGGFKVFIPYNVGLEYQMNRDFQIKNKDMVKQRIDNAIQSINKIMDETVAGISSFNNKKLNGLIGSINSLKESISKSSKDFLVENFDDFKHSSNHDYFDDSVRNRIDEIIDEVGEPYDSQSLLDVYKKADERFSKKIPPGFKDTKKEESYYHDGIEHIKKYGDLVIWMQLLDFIEKCDSGTTVLFVTNDLKNDFWKSINEHKIPHPHLKKEAKSKNSNVSFDMLTADEFFNQIMIDNSPEVNSTEAQNAKDEIKETINSTLNNFVIETNSSTDDPQCNDDDFGFLHRYKKNIDKNRAEKEISEQIKHLQIMQQKHKMQLQQMHKQDEIRRQPWIFVPDTDKEEQQNQWILEQEKEEQQRRQWLLEKKEEEQQRHQWILEQEKEQQQRRQWVLEKEKEQQQQRWIQWVNNYKKDD